MTKNMGTLDRRIRAFVVAPVLVVLGLLLGPTAVVSWIFYVLAGVMLLTSAVGTCPLYLPFHLSTRRDSAARVSIPAGR